MEAAAGRKDSIGERPVPRLTDGENVDKKEIIDKQKKYLFSCVATYYDEPLVVDHAKDQYVYDTDGREFLDFFGGILTVSVGHCNDKVTQAIDEQTHKVQHMSTLYANEPQVRLAEKLAQITPGRLEKSFFTNSGTEANETAVLLAQIYTKCQDIITLRHSYSGRSYLALSLSAQSSWRLMPNVVPGVHHIANAYCYRCPFGLTYPSCDLKCAKDAEEAIQTMTSQGRDRRVSRRTDSRRGRIHRPAERIFSGDRRHHSQIRRIVHLRRGTNRPGGAPAEKCSASSTGAWIPTS